VVSARQNPVPTASWTCGEAPTAATAAVMMPRISDPITLTRSETLNDLLRPRTFAIVEN
jgi:hypothetical protein